MFFWELLASVGIFLSRLFVRNGENGLHSIHIDTNRFHRFIQLVQIVRKAVHNIPAKEYTVDNNNVKKYSYFPIFL